MSGQNNGDPFDAEIAGASSFPFSFPSQPPDVRNWFSSYEYEPPPDSSELFPTEESERECPLVGSVQYVPETEPDADADADADDAGDRNRLPDEPGARAARVGAVGSTSSSIGEGAGEGLGVQFAPETTELCDGDGPDDVDGKLDRGCQVGGADQVAAEIYRDGFISTKKEKKRKVDCSKRAPTENGDNFVLREQRRRGRGGGGGVLADRSNIQEEVAPEGVGKWRCPRKSKPCVGPPMKQLRLERWVRRLG